ncbi:MAG: phasin family protein [Dokdonella sp.]
MNKPKLKSKKVAEESVEQARSAGKSIVDSAQHIWLAGLGAFAKAQAEGTKLFDRLVREGMAIDARTRKFTEGKVEEMRGTVESTVGQARQRTQETWDNLEKIFETRVSRSLNKLGIPGRDEIKNLSGRVEDLSREVGKLAGKSGQTTKPAAGSKTATAKRKAVGSVARVRDEIADVAKELEAAQLAAKKASPAPKATKAAKAVKPAKKASTAKAAKTAKPAKKRAK